MCWVQVRLVKARGLQDGRSLVPRLKEVWSGGDSVHIGDYIALVFSVLVAAQEALIPGT